VVTLLPSMPVSMRLRGTGHRGGRHASWRTASREERGVSVDHGSRPEAHPFCQSERTHPSAVTA
jgi:hypothetical protein